MSVKRPRIEMNPEFSERLCLAPHVRARRVASHVVLLDLKRNEYSAATDPDASDLARWIVNWPASSTAVAVHSIDGTPPRVAPSLLREMSLAGMIVAAHPPPKTSSENCVELPTQSIADSYATSRRLATFRDAYNMARAVSLTRAMLTFRTLEWITNRFTVRRQRALGHSRNYNNRELHDVASMFHRLRLFFYTPLDACLFDTIAFGEFLALYRFFPTWVFGVAVEPFRAHCWLQNRSTLLSGNLRSVLDYEPIAVV